MHVILLIRMPKGIWIECMFKGWELLHAWNLYYFIYTNSGEETFLVHTYIDIGLAMWDNVCFGFVLFYFVVINIYFLTSLHSSCMGWHLCSGPHSPKNARPILRRRYRVVIMGHAHTANDPIGLWSEDGTRIDCLIGQPIHSI